ncbi:hypothetical protein PG996_008169 [Apiospora saccharicola]|uniref:Uncharacterized protein n=1 Tax=Apiospora saccharicola TaxID=335842 RepID=A0ABR1UXU2_9PEZI
MWKVNTTSGMDGKIYYRDCEEGPDDDGSDAGFLGYVQAILRHNPPPPPLPLPPKEAALALAWVSVTAAAAALRPAPGRPPASTAASAAAVAEVVAPGVETGPASAAAIVATVADVVNVVAGAGVAEGATEGVNHGEAPDAVAVVFGVGDAVLAVLKKVERQMVDGRQTWVPMDLQRPQGVCSGPRLEESKVSAINPWGKRELWRANWSLFGAARVVMAMKRVLRENYTEGSGVSSSSTPFQAASAACHLDGTFDQTAAPLPTMSSPDG